MRGEKTQLFGDYITEVIKYPMKFAAFIISECNKYQIMDGVAKQNLTEQAYCEEFRRNNIFTVHSVNDIIPTKRICFVVKGRRNGAVDEIFAYYCSLFQFPLLR